MVDVFEVIHNRSSVRSFSPKPIDAQSKKAILEAAIRAPNAGGSEQWLFVSVESEDARKALHRLLVESHRLYFTKLLVKPWTDEKFKSWLSNLGEDYYFAPLYIAVFADLTEKRYCDPALERLWAHQSCAAAVENMILAAGGMGIGSCWFGVPLLLEEEFKRLLGMESQDLHLSAVVGFGYPKAPQKPRPRRRDLASSVKVL